MADIETSAGADNGSPKHHSAGAIETYGEAYFRFYHTGLGAIPYERSHHWLTFFATIADEIVRAFRPASVLDAGCAMGLLVEALWDRGVRAEGIDISNYAIANVRPDMRAQCRTASLTDPIEGTFDLVTCIEVLEHLERADAAAAIVNICSVAQTVLFSSTPSDFSEPTHVNVCPPIVWIELFAAQGFGPDLLADGTFLTPHTMIFRRGYPCDPTLLQTYALISRYRIMSAERFEALDAERKNALLAKAEFARAEAAHASDMFAVREALRDAETRAADAQTRAAQAAQAHAESLAALESRLQAEAQASLQARQHADAQAQLHSEALAQQTAELANYRAQVHELQRLLGDIQGSHSWRLTRPIRLAVKLARTARNPFKRLVRTGK